MGWRVANVCTPAPDAVPATLVEMNVKLKPAGRSTRSVSGPVAPLTRQRTTTPAKGAVVWPPASVSCAPSHDTPVPQVTGFPGAETSPPMVTAAAATDGAQSATA